MLDVSHSILRFKICSVVLRPGLKPACCSAMVVTAWCFSLFNRTFSMALLGWPIRLIVRYFCGKCNDQRLGPWYSPFSCLPDLIADFM